MYAKEYSKCRALANGIANRSVCKQSTGTLTRTLLRIMQRDRHIVNPREERRGTSTGIEGDAKGGEHGQCLNETTIACEPIIQQLPNELLGMILADSYAACANALVCSRWRDLVDVLHGRDTHTYGKRVRLLPASSALSTLAHLPPVGIDMALQSVLPVATAAHLLPLLIASGKPEHIDYALGLWADESRTIDHVEAAQWIAAHDRLEARFDPAWPHTVQPRRFLDCNHDNGNVRAIASCVMLSVAARHTHQSSTLWSVSQVCRVNPLALRKAAYVAAAEDRRDALGVILHLYARSIFDYDSARHFFGPCDSINMERRQYMDAACMMATLHTIVGTYGSLECAKTIDLFHRHKSITPLTIISPAWYYENGTRYDAGTVGDIDGLLDALRVLLGGRADMRETKWLAAAIVADRPEMLDLYSADVPTGEFRAFADAARLGKRLFCEAIMARIHLGTASPWCNMIDAPDNAIPFTLEGVRWLADQAWYAPRAGTVLCVMDNLFCERAQVCASRLKRLCDTIDALGLMAERWPAAVQTALVGRHDRIGPLLVSCIMLADNCKERDLFDVLMGHLDRCALIETLSTASAVERAWSYLCDVVAANAVSPNWRTWTGCDPCMDTPMVVVFGTLLNRYLRTPSGNIGAHGQVELRPLHRDHVLHTLDGTRHSLSKDDSHLQSALRYLEQHGLLRGASF